MLRQSPRPNSFRNVVTDGFGMAAVLAAVASAVLATTGYSDGPIRDAISDKQALEASDKNKDTFAPVEQPSGDPTESAADEAKSNMLGMTLELNRAGEVVVTDVGATSPAGDAGIRKGDTLVSLAGLKANDLSQWVKDVGKVLHETADGEAVPLEVRRGDANLSLRVKVPKSRAAEVRQAQHEQKRELAGGVQGAPMPAGQIPNSGYAQPPAGAVAPYGAGVGGGGVGFDFGVFGEESNANGVAANRALARLTATGGQSNPIANPANPVDRNASATNPRNGRGGQQVPATAQGETTSGGSQIGVAAFQNNGQGVAAYVEVHGLPRGSYLVGLNEGGLGGGGNNPFNQLQRPNQQPNQNQPPGSNGQPPAQRATNPGNPTPPPAPPQNPRSGASLGNPQYRDILAQQVEPPNPAAASNRNPAAPNTVNPPNSGNAAASPQSGPTPAGAPQFAIAIGRLQVGPDGSATIQQQLEGTQVQNLSGMSVSVLASKSQGGGGVEPTDVNQGPGANRNPAATRIAAARQAGQPDVGETLTQPNEVVATGVVQLLEGNSAPGAAPQTGQAPAGAQRPQVVR